MSSKTEPFVITFCGQNGCGKSTIIQQLRDNIELCTDLTVETFKAPVYSTESGEKIRNFLAGQTVDEDIETLFHKNRLEVNA
jgi:thymidylate kinase